MKTVIHLGDNPITLSYSSFADEIDVDEMLKIDYSNLFGEILTMPTLVNRFGLLKAEAEYIHNVKKLNFEMFESRLRQEIREKSNKDAKKLTEKGLDEEVSLNEDWIKEKTALLKAKKDIEVLDTLYFSAQDKSRKLNVIIKPVTPEELYDEIVEGTINGILVKKPKSLMKK